MRISTSQIQTLGINAILDQQVRLSKTQTQVASGQRITLPSDDPVGTSQMLALQQTLDTNKQYQANANAALDRLNLEDSTLQQVNTVLQRARELTVQGKNATQTNETRKLIATEVRQLLAQAVGLGNTKDGIGDYLFSGSMAGTQPFTPSATGYDYNGDQSQRMLQIASAHQIADGDPGSSVFQMVRNGNGTFLVTASAGNTGTGSISPGTALPTWTPTVSNGVDGVTIEFVQALPTDPITWRAYATGDPAQTNIATGNYVAGQAITVNGGSVVVSGTPADGDTFQTQSSQYQDLFKTLSNLATALETSVQTAQDSAQLQTKLDRTLSELDLGMGNIMNVEANVGARINAVESRQSVNDDQNLQVTQVLSSIKDLDYADAISRLNQQTVGLQAAQQAYLKVNSLSMFNFLK